MVVSSINLSEWISGHEDTCFDDVPDRFLEITVRRGYGGNHESDTVTTQSLANQPCQDAVPVRDMYEWHLGWRY